MCIRLIQSNLINSGLGPERRMKIKRNPYGSVTLSDDANEESPVRYSALIVRPPWTPCIVICWLSALYYISLKPILQCALCFLCDKKIAAYNVSFIFEELLMVNINIDRLKDILGIHLQRKKINVLMHISNKMKLNNGFVIPLKLLGHLLSELSVALLINSQFPAPKMTSDYTHNSLDFNSHVEVHTSRKSVHRSHPPGHRRLIDSSCLIRKANAPMRCTHSPACSPYSRALCKQAAIGVGGQHTVITAASSPSSSSSTSSTSSLFHKLDRAWMTVSSMCEEATEVETHHQQTAATTMGVAEDETPSSLTSSHPNTNNPNQEEWSKLVLASSSRIQTGPLSYVTSKGTFPQLAVVSVLKSKTIVWKFKSRSSLPSVEARELHEESNLVDRKKSRNVLSKVLLDEILKNIVYLTNDQIGISHNEVLVLAMYGLLTYFPELVVLRLPLQYVIPILSLMASISIFVTWRVSTIPLLSIPHSVCRPIFKITAWYPLSRRPGNESLTPYTFPISCQAHKVFMEIILPLPLVDNVEYESHFDLSEPGRKRSRYCMAFHLSSGYSLEDKTKNRKVNILELKTLDLHYGYIDYYVSENISMRDSKKIRERRTCRPADLASSNKRTASCSVVERSIRHAWLCIPRVYSRKTGLVTDRKEMKIQACRQTEQDDRKE
ncbi:hypothetical protein G5I_09884 [Acromyrmex echinatior]|uniref:Uncharacterized protein n=1 Tax=Acromyrmex echinatior TaxID=103372 RepID=F4WVE6_ACREC|nr:hypothetical protein G5I_09884 [Acromyrmex echinatior]